jgi:hypothetical protein
VCGKNSVGYSLKPKIDILIVLFVDSLTVAEDMGAIGRLVNTVSIHGFHKNASSFLHSCATVSVARFTLSN